MFFFYIKSKKNYSFIFWVRLEILIPKRAKPHPKNSFPRTRTNEPIEKPQAPYGKRSTTLPQMGGGRIIHYWALTKKVSKKIYKTVK